MGIKFGYRCLNCGMVFESSESIETHIDSNPTHIILEQYSSDNDSIPTNLTIESPNGTVFKITVDDDGVLTTEEVSE